MADVAESLVQYLRTKSAITDLVSDRISPDSLPQGSSLPAIVYYEIDNVSAEHLGGIAGVAHARFQIDCYATTRKQAKELQEKVRLAPLQGFRGTMHNTFVQGVSRAGSFRTDADEPKDGSDQWRYIVSADYIISHDEATS